MSINKYVIFSFLLLITACKEDEINSKLRGQLIGFVELIDENGQSVLEKSKVSVRLDDTNIETRSDNNGRFELKNIHPGTYNINLSKEDFGQNNIFSLPIVGGDEAYIIKQRIKIYQQPQVKVEFMNIKEENGYIAINLKINGSINNYFTAYLSTENTVSAINYDHRTTMGYSGFHSNEVSLNFNTNNLQDNLKNATTLYVMVTARNKAEQYSTYNPMENLHFYTSEIELTQATPFKR